MAYKRNEDIGREQKMESAIENVLKYTGNSTCFQKADRLFILLTN
jgi:hypothetical protein